jgi:hypothetical protein
MITLGTRLCSSAPSAREWVGSCASRFISLRGAVGPIEPETQCQARRVLWASAFALAAEVRRLECRASPPEGFWITAALETTSSGPTSPASVGHHPPMRWLSRCMESTSVCEAIVAAAFCAQRIGGWLKRRSVLGDGAPTGSRCRDAVGRGQPQPPPPSNRGRFSLAVQPGAPSSRSASSTISPSGPRT